MVALGISEFDSSHISDAIIKDSILHWHWQDRDDKLSSDIHTSFILILFACHAHSTLALWHISVYEVCINSISQGRHNVLLATVPSGSSVMNFKSSIIDATASSALGWLTYRTRRSWDHNEVHQNTTVWTEAKWAKKIHFSVWWNR